MIVDGSIVAENKAPPFDQFTWDLKNYLQAGAHRLQVSATDSLGLTGTSIEVPVEISVQNLEADPWFVLRSNLTVIALLLAVLAGGFLFLVLVLGGRIRPSAQKAADQKRSSIGAVKLAPIHYEGRSNPNQGRANRLQRSNMPAVPEASAYLHRMAEGDMPVQEPPIPISSAELLVGSDPSRSNLYIEDACIEGLHARLSLESDESFRLADLGSIAGTWVNFNPIPKEGVILQNGDLIHFGRIGFRFSTSDSRQVLKPTVILEECLEPEAKNNETDMEEPDS